MPKVSVIMPTFNRAWIIERAIKSVLEQSYKDFELIIINDGSTDNTGSVLEKFDDGRISIVKLETNGGLSHARNIGLKMATGEFVAYLDSDNIWYKDFLKVSIESFDDQTKMVYSGQNMFLVGGTKEEPIVLARKTRNLDYNLAKLTRENYIDVNCVVHRRIILEEVGYFDETLKVLEDWDLFVQTAIKYPFGIKHIDQVLGEYYYFMPETAETLSNKQWQKSIEEYFGVDKAEGDDLKIKTKIQNLLKEK